MTIPVGRLLRPVRAGGRRSRLQRHGHRHRITVTSAAFGDAGAMPAAHAGNGVGDNISPPLAWTGSPVGTAAILLAIEDIDVPLVCPLLHTVAILPPTVTALDEGVVTVTNPELRFIRTVLGSGYAGPRPLVGHGPHRYRFWVFALDAAVPADVTGVRALVRHLRSTVIGAGVLTGTYER